MLTILPLENLTMVLSLEVCSDEDMPRYIPALCQYQYAEAPFRLLVQDLCLQLTKVTLPTQHIHAANTGRFSDTASQLMASALTEYCSHF